LDDDGLGRWSQRLAHYRTRCIHGQRKQVLERLGDLEPLHHRFRSCRAKAEICETVAVNVHPISEDIEPWLPIPADKLNGQITDFGGLWLLRLDVKRPVLLAWRLFRRIEENGAAIVAIPLRQVLQLDRYLREHRCIRVFQNDTGEHPRCRDVLRDGGPCETQEQ
jgi:hypothetical protein